MEKAANEFLEQSGRLYETNKIKWGKMLHNKGLVFDEDIYNDSIVKTYQAILKKDVDGDYMGYWYKTFLNNTNRDTKYAYHNRVDDDVFELLKEKIDEESNVNLYYSAISDILLNVRKHFDRKTFEVFRMYLLCNMSLNAEVTPQIPNDYKPTMVSNVTGGSETENLANALSKAPIKAYVVESDITTTQQKVAKRNKETSF